MGAAACEQGSVARRLALKVEYQGTNYNGFQLQLNQPTIQGALEGALKRFTGESIRIRGASRTDSGAHSQGQVVDFLTASRYPAERFPAALNFFLAEDIRVQWAAPVAEGFHSRRSALSRVYQYRILARKGPPALLRHTHLWERAPLDAKRMAEAAQALTGTHDFRVISPSHPRDRSAVRTVSRWEVRGDTDLLVIECEANGFLKQQIRKANGILLEIGKGKRQVEFVDQALKGTRDISDIPVLSARGLCLMEVKYPEGTFSVP